MLCRNQQKAKTKKKDKLTFVGSVVNGDDGVNAVTVNDFLFNDWLSDVVNVVLNVLVDLFA